MFDYNPNKLGARIDTGMNAIIHKYDDGKYTVKRFVVLSKEKEKQYRDEFLLGINHKHQNILNYEGFSKVISDPDKDGDREINIYIKMKPMKKNLQEYVREQGNNQIPESQIINIFYCLASALDYLKDKGIAHSNIVHESVLFNDKGTVKLGGFAFAKFKPWKNFDERIYQSYSPPERPSTKSKSKQKNIIEQMTEEEKKKKMKEAKKLTFESDVWCLGKLMVDVCLLCDQAEKGRDQKPEEILKKTQDDLAKVQMRSSETLTNILRSLLEEKPEKRPTFAEICTKLEPSYLAQVLNAPFDNDDDSPVANNLINPPPEEEKAPEANGIAQAESASQNGSNSILNQGMMIDSSLALSLSAYMRLSESTRATSQPPDDYVHLLTQFYDASRLQQEIASCILSQASAPRTNPSEQNLNPLTHQNPSPVLNDFGERLNALSNQALGAIRGPSNSNPDSKSVSNSNSNPITLFSVLKELNAKTSNSQKSDSNSAPLGLSDIGV